MNKKRKVPVFNYPFESLSEEKDKEMLEIVDHEYISEKGSRIRVVQTLFSGGYRKLTLTETIYVKNADGGKKLSDVLQLKPQDQIPREKYLVFDVGTTKKGAMRMTKKDSPKEFTEFNKNERSVILYFYELTRVALAKAPKDLDFIYKNEESLRMAIVKINRKFSFGFKSLKSKEEKKLIAGTGKGYSFNSNIRLNTITNISK